MATEHKGGNEQCVARAHRVWFFGRSSPMFSYRVGCQVGVGSCGGRREQYIYVYGQLFFPANPDVDFFFLPQEQVFLKDDTNTLCFVFGRKYICGALHASGCLTRG